MTTYEQWPWHELCSVLRRYTDEVITPAARLREDLYIDGAAIVDEWDDAFDDARTVGEVLWIIRRSQ